MNVRRLIQIALLGVVAVTLVIVLRPQTDGASGNAPVPQNLTSEGAAYVAYYFHGNVRCDTCRSIEAQAEDAVLHGFPAEIANGTLAWQTVNTDLPENAHFIEEFGLTHSTLVIVEREGTETRRFAALERVWELVHDEDDLFRDYVQGEVANWVRADS